MKKFYGVIFQLFQAILYHMGLEFSETTCIMRQIKAGTVKFMKSKNLGIALAIALLSSSVPAQFLPWVELPSYPGLYSVPNPGWNSWQYPMPNPGWNSGPFLGQNPMQYSAPNLGQYPAPNLGLNPVPNLGQYPVPDLGWNPVPDLGWNPGQNQGRNPGRDQQLEEDIRQLNEIADRMEQNPGPLKQNPRQDQDSEERVKQLYAELDRVWQKSAENSDESSRTAEEDKPEVVPVLAGTSGEQRTQDETSPVEEGEEQARKLCQDGDSLMSQAKNTSDQQARAELDEDELLCMEVVW